MQISVSNIAWRKGKTEFTAFLDALVKENVFAVELALSCIFDEPTTASQEELKWLKSELACRSIKCVSVHSLTYTRPDLKLFGSYQKRYELKNYLLDYIKLANYLDCHNVVFGSPSARVTFSKSKSELDDIFLSFLDSIDNDLRGTAFNIEPLSAQYTEYLNTFEEGVKLIERASLRNIFVQLDVRTLIETKENIRRVFKNPKFIRHVHTSNPGMTPPGAEHTMLHQSVSCYLKKMGYQGHVTAEVIFNGAIDAYENLKSIIFSIRELYIAEKHIDNRRL